MGCTARGWITSALELALKERGLEYEREVDVPVACEGQVVTTRRVDFVICDEQSEVLLETKARSALLPEGTEQCLLYLYQGRHQVCLLANFGEKPLGKRRFVYTPPERKGS